MNFFDINDSIKCNLKSVEEKKISIDEYFDKEKEAYDEIQNLINERRKKLNANNSKLEQFKKSKKENI